MASSVLFYRPAGVPVDGAAVDEGRELAAADPQGVPDGRHAEDDVEVVPDARDERREDHVARRREAHLPNDGAQTVHDLQHLVAREEA